MGEVILLTALYPMFSAQPRPVIAPHTALAPFELLPPLPPLFTPSLSADAVRPL